MEPIRIIHLTDLHINAPSAKEISYPDAAQQLQKVIESIQASNFKPDAVVITGDLIHEGDCADYQYLRKQVDHYSAKLMAPIFVGLGNHDHRETFYEGYLNEAPSPHPYYYSQNIQGFRFIMLDTVVPGSSKGIVDAEQLEWLKQELATPSEKGTLIGLHHPLMEKQAALPASMFLSQGNDLLEVIRGSDVLGLASGHIHCNLIAAHDGMLSIAALGTASSFRRIEDSAISFVSEAMYNQLVVSHKRLTVQTVSLPIVQKEFRRLSMTDIFGKRE